jgi:hypothetical protein
MMCRMPPKTWAQRYPVRIWFQLCSSTCMECLYTIRGTCWRIPIPCPFIHEGRKLAEYNRKKEKYPNVGPLPVLEMSNLGFETTCFEYNALCQVCAPSKAAAIKWREDNFPEDLLNQIE